MTFLSSPPPTISLPRDFTKIPRTFTKPGGGSGVDMEMIFPWGGIVVRKGNVYQLTDFETIYF